MTPGGTPLVTLLMAVARYVTSDVITDTRLNQTTDTSIDTYIQLSSTQAFINSFSEGIQRTVIRAQLLFCPKAGFCTHKVDTHFLGSPDSCAHCYCGPNCKFCCADEQFLNKTTWDTLPYLCLPTQYFRNHGDRHVNLVSLCPIQYSQERRVLCEGPHLGQLTRKLSDTIPVTVFGRTKHVFRNQYCALCNGRPVEDLVYHRIHIVCNSTGEKDFMLHDDFLDLNTFRAYCPNYSIYFKSNKGTPCDPDINSACNSTGMWQQADYDPIVERACYSYSSIYMFGTSLFKNVFCVMCNGYTPDTYNKYSSNSSWYGAMLNWKYFKTEVTRYVAHELRPVVFTFATDCSDPRTYWDVITRTCKRIQCAMDRTLHDGECIEDATFTVTEKIYLMHLELEGDTVFIYTLSAEEVIRTDIQRRLQNSTLLEQLEASVCETSIRTYINNEFHAIKIQARIQIYVRGTHRPRIVVDWIKGITLDPFTVLKEGRMAANVRARVVAMASRKLSLRWSNQCKLDRAARDSWIDVHRFKPCPMLEIWNWSLPWRHDAGVLTFISSGLNLSSSDYILKYGIIDGVAGNIESAASEFNEIGLCIRTYERLVRAMLEVTGDVNAVGVMLLKPTYFMGGLMLFVVVYIV